MSRGRKERLMAILLLFLLVLTQVVGAQPAPSPYQVCVRADAGKWEKKAAEDLAFYLGKLTGRRPLINNAPSGSGPHLIVGELALQRRPALRKRLADVAKKNPVLRADAIVLQSDKTDLYLAGSNDDSHYFAVVELLRRLGCRWYIPTEFGECIPTLPALQLPNLDYAYAPPFEVRSYWISWNGSQADHEEFSRRNFMNLERVPSGHALGQYINKLKKPGFSISSPETAQAVFSQIEPQVTKGESLSLSMEDGSVGSDSKAELEMSAGLEDKFFNVPALTDVYLTFYNQVCQLIQQRYPNSHTKIGFLAYINLSLPPQRVTQVARQLICYLAPIDIDPNHSMDDPRSPERQDYRHILQGWSRAMEGRVVIYDYDQGMLIWRDLPDPSQQVIRRDIQEYRKAGILGLDTECRNAVATTFLNIYMRGQLYWNPDLDVDRELSEFYPAFYGPAAKTMESYWQTIFRAWKDTQILEHEYFVIPAIYPRTLVNQLKVALGAGPAPGSLPEPYATRVRAASLGFEILDAYTASAEAAATRCEYAEAARQGSRGLEIRSELKKLSAIFVSDNIESGPAFWPGEVETYKSLAHLIDGSKGTLIEKTPLSWSFRIDPHDHGLWQGWASDNSGTWNTSRTDLYLQAQPGFLSGDSESPQGFAWYRCNLKLSSAQIQGALHLIFPGIFNESWLYLNGKLVAHHPQKALWWTNDYEFGWDAEVAGNLRQGDNLIVVRTRVPHHFAGIFRRPFLYRAR